jgi:mono/diheme cytochrome c family protein
MKNLLRLGTALLIIGVVIGLYFAFRRTLVADALEAVSGVDAADTLAYGATLFQTRGCAGCHTLESAGAMGDEGPNLTGIAARHDEAYIRQSITTPDAVIAENCPEGECRAGIMPPFGSFLTPEQIDALVLYLMQQ